jgi:hypothetical protein
VALSVRLVEAVSSALSARTSRRGFLARTSLAATALAVAPAAFALRPVDAYALVCDCNGRGCDCGGACCDGFTEFCCTLHNGSNTCPPGTFAGGWWKADGSAFCNGPRFYIDCHSECACQGDCTNGIFCGPGCDGLDCGCAFGDCNHRAVGCSTFRYGQCHTEIGCSGRIACRVVTCQPAYLFDNACGSEVLVDDSTAGHDAPCLHGPPVALRAFGFAAPAQGGQLVCAPDGGVFAFGGAAWLGSMAGHPLNAPVVGIAPSPSGQGYWLVSTDGGVFSFGQAGFFGSAGSLRLFAPVVGMVATSTGLGYWLYASDGGIFNYGDAHFQGSIGGHVLNAPVVGMAPTPSGQGYWLVASDGGVFNFGDARFAGSLGGRALTAPVAALVPTPTGAGYYLLGQDGAVYSFGDAVFAGSYHSLPPDGSLRANGVDSFYGMVLDSSPANAPASYTLFAMAGVTAPPVLRSYQLPPS